MPIFATIVKDNNNGRAANTVQKKHEEKLSLKEQHPDPWTASMGELMNQDSGSNPMYSLLNGGQGSNGATLSQVAAAAAVQAKLEIGEPGDKFEQEADAMSDKVTMMPEQDKDEKVQMTLNEKEKSIPDISNKEFLQMVADMDKEEEIQQKSEEEIQQASASLENQLNSRKGNGNPLPNQTKDELENKMGADFSNVKIHTNSNAVQMSKEIGAQAFTHGNDIFFNKGKFSPDSSGGKHLLAHELTHTLQQKGKKIQRQEKERREEQEEKKKEEEQKKLNEKLDEIESRYRKMIAGARLKGFDVAADNLEWFLEGGGGKRTISVSWLRGFIEVIEAERINQGRFETKNLIKQGIKLEDGESKKVNTFWDRLIKGDLDSELFFASGDSTLTSTGSFTLTRAGDKVTISGKVDHHWWDVYDWHAGLTAFIPGFGAISDSDALLLQKHRGAAPFDMEADWVQNFTGTIDLLVLFKSKFNWTGP